MKKKTFFATLLLFLLFFNSVILLISLLTLRENFSAVRERCLAEHFIIASALIGDIRAVEGRGGQASDTMAEIMSPYTRYSQNKTMSMAVSMDDRWIWTSDGETEEEPQIPPLISDAVSSPVTNSNRILTVHYIRTAGSRQPLLCIYGRLAAPYESYGLLYTYNLSGMMASWRSSKNMMFMAGLLAAGVLACCLLYLLNLLFRPLRQIASASHDIASGRYKKRLPVTGSDETAAMAQSFNRMAAEIEIRIAQLEESARQKQQFIDNFAHELRTPLTAIYGYAEYLQKAAISEKDKYASTQFIMSECSRLQSLAGQLLELACMDTVMEEFPVKGLFTASQRTMQVKASYKKISLHYSNHIDILYGNRELLETLLNNLVDNAVKASPEESDILVSGEYQNGRPVFTVQDSGIGMDEEQLSHITDAFYRADKARSRKSGGAGLGLSICLKIADLHNAELVFASEPGKGTMAQVIFTTP